MDQGQGTADFDLCIGFCLDFGLGFGGQWGGVIVQAGFLTLRCVLLELAAEEGQVGV